jgi:hypothetical protein
MRQVLRVIQVWNGTILREHTLHPPRPVLVGDAPRCDFNAPIDDAALTLLQPTDDGYALNLDAGMAWLAADGPLDDWAEGPRQILIREGEFGSLRAGDMELHLQWTTPETWSRWIPGGAVQSESMTSWVVSGVAHATLLLLLIALVPRPQSQVSQQLQDRIVGIITQGVADAMPEPMPEPDTIPQDDEEGGREPLAGEEGRMGDEDNPPIENRISQNDGPEPTDTQSDLGVAFNQAFTLSGGLSSVFATNSNIESAMDGVNFMTSGADDSFALGTGVGGLGLHGIGPGGGGNRTVGGLTNTIGRGDGDGNGDGNGPVALQRREERGGTVRRGNPRISTGFCQASMIEQRVRRHIAGVRACYEQALQNDRTLSGRITAQWTIGLDGTVTSVQITENSMNSDAVEQCISSEVRRMRFEQPDGGTCVVAFPFTFRSAD